MAFLPVRRNEPKALKNPSVTLMDIQTLIFRSSSFQMFFPQECTGQSEKQVIHRRRRQKKHGALTLLALTSSLPFNAKRVFPSDSHMNRAVARSLATESNVKIRTDISFTLSGTPHSTV